MINADAATITKVSTTWDDIQEGAYGTRAKPLLIVSFILLDETQGWEKTFEKINEITI